MSSPLAMLNPITLFKYNFSRNPRSTFIFLILSAYYTTSVGGFLIHDLTRPNAGQAEPKYEDAFYMTDEGTQVLGMIRDKQRREWQQRKQRDAILQQTEQGKAQLELEKQQRGLTLRFRATQLQLEVLKLQQDIERGENLVRQELVRTAREAHQHAGQI